MIIRYNSRKCCLYLSFNYPEGYDSSKISLVYRITEWVSGFLFARRLFNGEFSLPRFLIFPCSCNTWKHFSTSSVICFIQHIKKNIIQVLELRVWSNLFCLLCEMSHTWTENLASLNLTEVISIGLHSGKILSTAINKDASIY